MSWLEVHQVAKSYRAAGFRKPAQPVLTAIDLQLERGSSLAVMGANGQGKTTLMRLVTGLDQPDAGTITLAGQPLKQALKQHPGIIGMVFQDYRSALNPRLKVAQSLVELASSPVTLARRDQVLDWVGLSTSVLTTPVTQLSGGQAQRLNIARALLGDAQLLIFDEGFSAIDLVTTVALLDQLHALQARLNLSYLFVEHDVQIARYAATRGLKLHDGQMQNLW